MSGSQFSILKFPLISVLVFFSLGLNAQLNWRNVDIDFAPLPKGFHVFKTMDSLDGKPFVAYYAIAGLKNKKLLFTTDTTYKRRLTPAGFYEKIGQPLLVVNSTFFSFGTNQNLNLVMQKGKTISYNVHSLPMRGKDTLQYRHPFASAIGISQKGNADVAWTYTDSSITEVYAVQRPVESVKDSLNSFSFNKANFLTDNPVKDRFELRQWRMQTAVGGGPVLVQNGQVNISNNEELKFAGKAINDKHPRTMMGYTKDHKMIIMVVEGRNPGVAEGASLLQAAKIMVDLGCVEALNLDGGGSSCMLINGKETIKPSDKGLQRAIPAVFIISQKGK